MFKRRTAVLAAIVSVGGAAGALGAFVPAAQAWNGYVCIKAGSPNVSPNNYQQLRAYERKGYTCFQLK